MELVWDIDFLYRAFLIFLRLGAFLLFIPLFEGRGVPALTRVAFALLMTNLVAMVVPQHPVLPIHAFGLVVAGISEVMVGLFMGLTLRIAFQAIAIGGELIALKSGFMRDMSFDPFTQTQSSAVERLISQFAVVIFLTTGMHLVCFSSFVKSFEVVSLGHWMPTQGTILALIWQTSQMFTLAVQIAAPFIAMNFIINMAFAVLGKAAPQINVFVVSFAITIVCGLFLLVSTLDVTTQHIIGILGDAAKNLLMGLQAK